MLYRTLSLALVALALVAFVCSPALAADKAHDGTIVKAGDGKLTMKDADGKEQTHAVPPEAKISCDGKDCKLEDLKAGFKVTVTVKDDKTVTKIDAKTK
jgi:hypothetical protein